MSTIKEVAQLAGVSVATVSRVLNHEQAVMEKTREKVLAAIEMLQYQPNLLGRNLRQSATRKILVLLPTMSNQFYSKIVAGIEERAREYGYHAMVCITYGDRDVEAEYLSLLRAKFADGVIFLNPVLSAEELSKLNRDYPVVQCSEYLEKGCSLVVSIDNERAAYDAVSLLIDRGHRHIAFLGAKDVVTSGRLRRDGYCRALREHGLPVRQEDIYLDSYGFKSGIRWVEQVFLQKAQKPTAVFAIADTIAVGVMKALLQRGWQIPEQLALVGFDDTAIAQMYHPGLTTISQPRLEMGQQSMELLLEKMKDPHIPDRKLLLPYEIRERETTVPRNN